MLYIANTTEAQTLYIPKNITGEGELSLIIRGTVSREEIPVTIEEVEALNDYLEISAQLPREITPGEYLYIVKAGEQVIGTGLAMVGDFIAERSQFQMNVNFSQYGV